MRSFLVALASFTSTTTRTSRPKYLGLDVQAASGLDDYTLYTSRDHRTTRENISPRGLNNVFELEQRIVCCLRILGVYRRVQVVGDGGAPNETSHGVVDIHDFARRHRSDRLNMGLSSLLQGSAVHSRAHHNHLVDCLHDLLGVRAGDRLQEEIRCPVHILDEWVRSSRELASSRADRATR